MNKAVNTSSAIVCLSGYSKTTCYLLELGHSFSNFSCQSTTVSQRFETRGALLHRMIAALPLLQLNRGAKQPSILWNNAENCQ